VKRDEKPKEEKKRRREALEMNTWIEEMNTWIDSHQGITVMGNPTLNIRRQ